MGKLGKGGSAMIRRKSVSRIRKNNRERGRERRRKRENGWEERKKGKKSYSEWEKTKGKSESEGKEE